MRLSAAASAALMLTLPLFATTDRLLAPLPVADQGTLAPAADPARFQFVVGGDNRAVAKNIPPPPTADQIFADLHLLRPAFALWTGDSIYGSDDTAGEAESEYADFLRAAAVARTPLFNAPGNHEIFNRAELARVYTARMGRLYGSFDYGRSHFIALDSEEVDRRPGIVGPQLDWLRQDLEANRTAAHIFVFLHHPLFPKEPHSGFADPANRDEVHQLFVRYRVSDVFSGHEHLYYASVHDGVHYVVTGGGGAPTDASPEDGGFQHYLFVSVDGDRVTTEVLQPWRLFIRFSPVEPDGSCTALVSNYQVADRSFVVEFPTDALGAQAVPTASWTYKGKTHPLSAALIPATKPGVLDVRVTVPGGRAALVSLHKAPPQAGP